MAYVTNNTETTLSHARSGVFAVFADLHQRYTRHRAFRDTFVEMNALSDRELADLGLHRSMLKGIAWQAVYGN
ncbi:MAG: DUF1127 domain-containing protein [Pseudomonadota bacterium]